MKITDPVSYFRQRAEILQEFAPAAAKAYEDAAEVVERIGVPAPALRIEPDAETDAAGESHMSWKERLWTAPADARIGRDELLDALGKSQSWLYALTSKKTPLEKRIPHRKTLDGELVFVVGEIRDWIKSREVIMVPGSLARSEVVR